MATTVSSSSELIAALARGGTIELEPATYTLRNAKFSRSDTFLVAANPDRPQPMIQMAASHSGPMLSGSGLSGIGFENIIIDGNFSNQPGATRGSSDLILVNLGSCSDISVRNCLVQNSAIDGFCLRNCHDILVEGNTVHDLGHEFIYALSCYGGTYRNNNVKTRTNSAFRISYGGSGFDIHDNLIWSWLDKASTGPGIELDKGNYSDIEIWNNSFKTLNGAGIWMFDKGGSCKNIHIHDNVFDTVGQYYTTSGTFSNNYNGYSNGCITGAGFNGAIIEDNIIQNVKYGLIMNEWKYSDDYSRPYKWTFRNNTLKNAVTGFRIDSSRGTIEGAENKFSDIATLAYGYKDNVKVTSTGPVDNVATTEIIKAVVTITDARGWTGKQEIDLATVEMAPIASDRVTVKYSTGGLYGNRTYNLPASTNASPTGSDWLVGLSMTREAGTQSHSFILPGIQGSGLNEFKLRTADGRYGECPLNIVLVEPEPEPEPEPTSKQVRIVHKVTMFVDNVAVLEKEYVEESMV
jgi:parallel beta-helix repeat protein